MSDKIGLRMMDALKDCASFKRGNYFWKRGTMTKLVKMGLAEEIAARDPLASMTAFAMTDAGLEVLRKHQQEG